MKRFFAKLFGAKCPDCTGRLKHTHDEYLCKTWVSVYECDTCDKRFV
jgi:hypothetical protein